MNGSTTIETNGNASVIMLCYYGCRSMHGEMLRRMAEGERDRRKVEQVKKAAAKVCADVNVIHARWVGDTTSCTLSKVHTLFLFTRSQLPQRCCTYLR